MSSSKVASVRRWRPKQYVLAGMAAIVAASTVVVVTSVLLHPARISFSVTEAMARPGVGMRPGTKEFFFNLTVDNPSRRAAVRYIDLVVNLQMDRIRKAERRVVQASLVGPRTPYEQPPANQMHMRVYGVLQPELNTLHTYDGRVSASMKMTIIVAALVRFRVGIAFTRLYGIRIFCSPVNFFNDTFYAAKVNCTD